jgi:ankyrin repeat protein
VRNQWGPTPLMDASACGHTGIMKALLAASADVNATSNYGETALIYACFYGRLEPARLLVAAKALVNVMDNDGYTPLNGSRGFSGAHADPAIEALLLATGATAGADWVPTDHEDESE